MKPKFLRRNFACPDCGLLIPEGDCGNKPFDCPRCQTHYTQEEFIELNQDKWKREHHIEEEQL